jgi:hypothetical protein
MGAFFLGKSPCGITARLDENRCNAPLLLRTKWQYRLFITTSIRSRYPVAIASRWGDGI